VDFDTLTLTEEDWQRGRMYAEERKRGELHRDAPSLEHFLKSLQMQVEIKKADGFTIPRIAQLTQRTNQFNLTTRRYTEAHIQTFCQSERSRVYWVGVKDRFGDNGIVGAAIVEQNGETWHIDTFLMSCRVIGRQIEKTLLTRIAREARASGIQRLRGEYLPTGKNRIAKDFYAQMGFQQGETGQWWSEVSSCDPDYSPFIQVCED
jgi:FkbH-like protein